MDVRIVALLPNPVGPDKGNETVTLKNFGTRTADISGWHLQDRAGNMHPLSGAIAPGETVSVALEGMRMPLNNSGDDVFIFDSDAGEESSNLHQRPSRGRC